MKKKIFGVLFSALACLTVAACNDSKPTEKTTTETTGQTTTETTSQTTTETTTNQPTTTETTTNQPTTTVTSEVPETEPVGVVFHYRRADGDYSKFKAIWVWPKGGGGSEYSFDKTDDYGVYTVVNMNLSDVTEVGLIVKYAGEWTKDGDADRFAELSLFNLDDDGYYHVYLVGGDSTIYTDPNGAISDGISDFSVNYKNGRYNLSFLLTTEATSWVIKKNGTELVTSATAADDEKTTSNKDELLKKFTYDLGEEMPSFEDVISISVDFPDEKTLTANAGMASLYSTPAFNALYTYDGELGAIYSETSTTFRVWSPISTAMKLRVYTNGTPVAINSTLGSDAYTEYTMTRGEKGTWEATVPGDLDGKYYTYVVTNYKYENKEVVDPYAKSTGVNGRRGMVVNFDRINAALGWDSFEINEYSATELAVYETHIADLTSSSTWTSDPELKALAKTYKGFYQEGTTYTANGTTVTTGFDHIKELGVNAVQIIPIFDSDNDEINRSFNWGYNPLNYNSLDGSYSTNPYDGYEKIKEFKTLVKSYTENGINIIMDVVYNHVMGADQSNFDVLMPYYYYRYNGSVLSNGSGCGNETASNMPMFRKFMVDSTEFWASEYKLGGFRFDLMGLHDLETMDALSTNLHNNVSEYVTVYGEPWAGGTPAYDSSKLAMQANIAEYTEYGCFNDKLRDALIKGGLNSKSAKGWVTGGSTYVIKKISSEGVYNRTLDAMDLYIKVDGEYVKVTKEDPFDSKQKYYKLEVTAVTDADINSLVRGISGFVLSAPKYFEKTVTAATFAEEVEKGIYVFDGEDYALVLPSSSFDETATYYFRKASNEPSQCVNYVTCHDNYTLYDRIQAAGITDEATVKKMAMLANSVVFTSQGITFMLAGEEFLRTKGGDENSYQSPYSVNELNYALKIKNADMFENYKKLISLKTQSDLFSAHTQEDCEYLSKSIQVSNDKAVIMYTYQLGPNEYTIIHVNGVASEVHTVDLAGYTLYLDTLNTGKELTNGYELEAYQTLIVYRSAQ